MPVDSIKALTNAVRTAKSALGALPSSPEKGAPSPKAETLARELHLLSAQIAERAGVTFPLAPPTAAPRGALAKSADTREAVRGEAASRESGEAKGISFADFFSEVGRGLADTQRDLDRRSEAYIKSLEDRPYLEPMVFRVPKVSGTMKFAMNNVEEKGVNFIFQSSSSKDSQTIEQQLSFEMVAAPAPPGAGQALRSELEGPPWQRVIVDPSERQRLFELVVQAAYGEPGGPELRDVNDTSKENAQLLARLKQAFNLPKDPTKDMPETFAPEVIVTDLGLPLARSITHLWTDGNTTWVGRWWLGLRAGEDPSKSIMVLQEETFLGIAKDRAATLTNQRQFSSWLTDYLTTAAGNQRALLQKKP